MDRRHFLSSGRWYGKFLRFCLAIILFTDPFRRISLLFISVVVSAGVIGLLVLQYIEGAFITGRADA